MADRVYYGGQAVIEGVMMRGQKTMVTAVRRPNGEVKLDTQPLSSLYTSRWRKIPLIRGIIVLIESVVLGIKPLLYSANVALEEEEAKISGGTTWIIMILALAFSIAIFFLGPLFLTRAINQYIPSSIVFNLIEGLIRMALFILYLRLISLAPDIKRVFSYHGAEHKAVNAFEAGVPLEVEPARKYSKAHVRCGTSFIFAVAIIAILVFSLVGRPSLMLMVVSRICLVPVIASLGYEFIYFSGRHSHNPVLRVLMTPGLWLQSLTTREPDDRQLEVALSALKKVIEIEQSPQIVPVQSSTVPSESSTASL
jgi:uncharacterized protein YqhQ